MIVRDTATVAEAEDGLTRASELLTSKAGTQQTYDQAKAARDTAVATVRRTRRRCFRSGTAEHAEIEAPFDGRLGDVAVNPGAFVTAGAAIITIAKYDPIYVKFHLRERDLRRLKQALAASRLM